MALEKGFEPHLAVGDTSVNGRDVEMLRAIDEHGSMHAAAEALGRSYPHLQRRVVELEEALGQLTERVRGGKGGGGTRLTDAALDLVRRFERLRIELAGVAAVPESILTGDVVERNGQLATVRTPAGDISARVPTTATNVEVAIRADAVVLMNPGSPSQVHTSLRNQLTGTVGDLSIEDALANVAVEVADGVTIDSVVTEKSIERLGLEPGSEVITAFKSTAARAASTELQADGDE